MALKPPIKIWTNQNSAGDLKLAAIFLVISFEIAFSAIIILLIGNDPKNSIFLGYSLQRIILFCAACMFGFFTLFTALRILTNKTLFLSINKLFISNTQVWLVTAFGFSLLGCMTLICPASLFSIYSGFFERLRPLLVVTFFIAPQITSRWISFDPQILLGLPWRYFLLTLSILVGLGIFVATSKIGLTPEIYYWNVAGMPITSLQMLVILLLSLIIFSGLMVFRKNFHSKNDFLYTDVLIFLGLSLCAYFVWQNTPMVKHFVSLQPKTPYFQPFPFGDARTHDLGAISILKGWGINFGEYTDKPLYMVFLAFLHTFSGYDYNLLAQFQLYFLALIPGFIYILGKVFHSRFVGITIAILLIIRQSNAILLSHIVASANPRILLTEIPTMFAMIVFTGLMFVWLRKPQGNPWIAVAAGGTLGATALIRLNPVMIMPLIPIFALMIMWKEKKKWLFQSAIFMFSFTLMLTPWIITGTNSNGQPYFFIKFMDVINTRYQPQSFNRASVRELAALDYSPLYGYAKNNLALSSDQNTSLIDVNHFPGFVFNHFFHNVIESFLSLPDSINPSDQNLKSLTAKPYWIENSGWKGELDPIQIPFIFANIGFVALGISWSLKKWRLRGLIPLFLFLVYLFSLGLARNSGSRYLVPIDWVIFLYYIIGLVVVVIFLSSLFTNNRGFLDIPSLYSIEHQPKTQIKSKYYFAFTILLLLLALSIPVANKFIASDNTLCTKMTLSPDAQNILNKNSSNQIILLKGEILYPELQGNRLSFVLLTCKKANLFTITNFTGNLKNGQPVVVGLMITAHEPEIIILASNKDNLPEIIWEKR